MALHIETPLLNSRALSLHSERAVWLKLEALQPPGSFKIRGIGLACEEYARRGARRFISSSGGNAGIAVAYAGRQLGIPVVVVVPETTSERARALIVQEGAEVIVHGAAWQEANALAQAMLTPQDAFLHPFDDPLLWQGHAGMIDEVARAGVKPDAVVLSVGGGGLLAGVAEGLQRNGWDDVALVAVETEGAASLAAAVAAREHVALPAVSSIATSLAARQVCAQAFAVSQARLLHSVVVSDRQAVAACQRFIDDHRLVVEPACGAALAAVYGQVPQLAPYASVLVIVCGGVTATTRQLDHWSATL
ncbi:MAG: pyridoxal-phosphate dependent enzyme [Janthinobacterium sp.]